MMNCKKPKSIDQNIILAPIGQHTWKICADSALAKSMTESLNKAEEPRIDLSSPASIKAAAPAQWESKSLAKYDMACNGPLGNSPNPLEKSPHACSTEIRLCVNKNGDSFHSADMKKSATKTGQHLPRKINDRVAHDTCHVYASPSGKISITLGLPENCFSSDTALEIENKLRQTIEEFTEFVRRIQSSQCETE